MLYELEKKKFEAAEFGRLQLQAELNLIQQQLDNETETVERCRKFLEPEEQAKLEESKDATTAGTNPSSLSISEQILLKYKRSNELRTFFE